MNNLEKADKNSNRFKLIKAGIFLSGLSVFAQLYLFQPLLPLVSEYFNTGAGNSSLLVSSSTIGMAIGLFFFAFKADAYPRKQLMVFSLLSSALLTVISAWIPNLSILIAIGFFKGFVISGVSAVALAYLTEEVEISSVALAISMYLSGNTIGGMSGRISATILAGEFGWKNAVMIIGIVSIALGLIFWKIFPSSRFFHPQKIDYSLKIKQMRRFLTDPFLLSLFCIAALIMGTFVSIYNYLSFRLEAPPFSLSHYFIALIFLMYIFGVFGTMLTSRLSKIYEKRSILKYSLIMMFASLFLFYSQNIYLLILGLAIFTLCFFSAHTMASQLVALRAKYGKSSATSIYWLFYYFGSSILGSGTGYLLHSTSWTFFISLLAFTLFIAFILSGKLILFSKRSS
ncbi:MFS transporter [Chryseobacterium gwangjuense]|uniref:MFS transporter n=1 Tax=Chryseobacterium gwangjuense TaxID=1069980 RepID=UPI001E40A3AA|nr:MFS transporter [Chryseobacterium gwangjuense]MCE3074193.1 MFS transporter [Chryseobacterium gwangjuense]